jgi:hypothetical protein
MNVSAIEPASSALTQSAAATSAPAKKPAAPAASAKPAASVAALSTPAATVTTTGVPATVKPEDRALYMQILKSVGGNVNMALAALATAEAKEANS